VKRRVRGKPYRRPLGPPACGRSGRRRVRGDGFNIPSKGRRNALSFPPIYSTRMVLDSGWRECGSRAEPGKMSMQSMRQQIIYNLLYLEADLIEGIGSVERPLTFVKDAG